MYQLEATVYEDQNHPSAYGEVWVGSNEFKQLLLTAHVAGTYDTAVGSLTHAEMMALFVALCAELAQNCPDSLF